MIEKICEIIDGEYVCDIDISVDEWKQLLNNPDVFDEKSLAALKKWYIEEDHACTCYDIGLKYNLHSMSANGVINGLGGRVQKALNRFQVKGVGKIAAGTRFITVMNSKETTSSPKRFLWTIRAELVEAIQALKIYPDIDSEPVMAYSDEALLEDIAEDKSVDSPETFVYFGQPQPKKEPLTVQNKSVYPRNPRTAKNALNKAGYRCEMGDDHDLFKRKNSDLNYTEPHHIIPMAQQANFEHSLDVEENIISLCCHCHKKIHLGQGYEEMLESIYARRKAHLAKVEIDIPLATLISFYK